MSASRDKSQKIGFVYSNLYEVYKKGVEAAKAAPDAPASDLSAPAPSSAPESPSAAAPVPAPAAASAPELKPASPALPRPGLTRGRVIKAESLSKIDDREPVAAVRVNPFRPAELLGKRIEAAHQAEAASHQPQPAAPSAAPAAPAGSAPAHRVAKPAALRPTLVPVPSAPAAAPAPAPEESKGVYAPSPQVIKAPENAAVQSLRDNLQKLNDLHSRLRFMLQELEDLVKED